MTTTLITGGNKGLGRETARRLLAEGHDVWLGARDPERGKVAADELGARYIELDVTSDSSVSAAASLLDAEVGHLDVLINNAGIPGGFRPPAETTADDMRTVYETNVFGLVRVTHAMLPLCNARRPRSSWAWQRHGILSITSDHRGWSPHCTVCRTRRQVGRQHDASHFCGSLPGVRVNAVDPATPRPTSTAPRRPAGRGRPRSSWRWHDRPDGPAGRT
jgi:NAD(P)-dependent dehydrogenase (short-subunit alcohol dehydrogenase family)